MRNVSHKSCKIKIKSHIFSEYVILTPFRGNDGYANAPVCYVYTFIASAVFPHDTQILPAPERTEIVYICTYIVAYKNTSLSAAIHYTMLPLVLPHGKKKYVI